jgi:hypothetical protein
MAQDSWLEGSRKWLLREEGIVSRSKRCCLLNPVTYRNKPVEKLFTYFRLCNGCVTKILYNDTTEQKKKTVLKVVTKIVHAMKALHNCCDETSFTEKKYKFWTILFRKRVHFLVPPPKKPK